MSIAIFTFASMLKMLFNSFQHWRKKKFYFSTDKLTTSICIYVHVCLFASLVFLRLFFFSFSFFSFFEFCFVCVWSAFVSLVYLLSKVLLKEYFFFFLRSVVNVVGLLSIGEAINGVHSKNNTWYCQRCWFMLNNAVQSLAVDEKYTTVYNKTYIIWIFQLSLFKRMINNDRRVFSKKNFFFLLYIFNKNIYDRIILKITAKKENVIRWPKGFWAKHWDTHNFRQIFY